MSENKCSHESLKENEETKNELNNLQKQPKDEVAGSDQMLASDNQEEQVQKEDVDDNDDKNDAPADDDLDEQDKADEEKYVIVNLSEILEDIECPICFGIIRNAKTVMACLHRFCGQCIEKCIGVGKNKCPLCRTSCSQLSLIDDPSYDALIAEVVPDIDNFENEELASLKEEFPQLVDQEPKEVVDLEEEEFVEEEFIEEYIAAQQFVMALPAFAFHHLYDIFSDEEFVVDEDEDSDTIWTISDSDDDDDDDIYF